MKVVMLKRALLGSVLMFGCSVFAFGAQAEEEEVVLPEIVVIGSLDEAPRLELGSSISVIDAEDIELRQVQNASDLLRDVPGVAVNRSGVFGALTGVRIRGAEADQTLVFINGAEAFDPADNGFSFANLATFDIERIEVLRGSQSALYGSEAVGGVINVITKGGAPGVQLEAEAEGGSFGTYQFAGAVGGGTEQLTGRLSLYYHSTDGQNVAYRGGEEESYENFTVNGQFRFTPNEIFELEGFVRYFDAEVGSDDDLGFLLATPVRDSILFDAANFTEEKEFSGRLKGGVSLFDGAWRHSAAVEYYDARADSISGPDSFFYFAADPVFENDGERVKYQYQSTGEFETGAFAHTVTGAVEYEEQTFINDSNDSVETDQTSFVGEYRIGFAERVFLSGGVRRDLNDLFPDTTTYRIALSALYPETGTRFHTSYGTGVQNPSFFELFGFTTTFQGNPALTSQSSKSFDVGIEQTLFDGDLIFDVTYFKAKLEDEITTRGFGPTFQAVNEDGQSNRQGVELFVDYAPFDHLSVSGSYTYTDAENADGSQEIRRPHHMASVNATLRFMENRGVVDVGVNYNGDQKDEVFLAGPSQFVTLDDYVLVNVATSYQIADNVELFGRVENLTDTEYEEVFGYRTNGIAGFGGLRIKFGWS